MNESFFGKNGTLQDALGVASEIGAHSVGRNVRTGFLASMVDFVKSLLMV